MTMTSSKSGLADALACPRMAAGNGEYQNIKNKTYFQIQTFQYCLGGTDRSRSNGVHRVQDENMSVDYKADLAIFLSEKRYNFILIDINIRISTLVQEVAVQLT